MTDPRQRPDTPRFQVDDEMDLLFARAHPNPTREGCLSVDAIQVLARRERSITDPGFEHLGQCSPCYREYRGFQQAADRARAAAITRRRRLGAAAAVLLVAGVGVWTVAGRRSEPATGPSRPVAFLHSARVDLRRLSVTRGAEPRSEGERARLPRGRVRAALLLPVGAEPGDYEVRLLDDERVARASAVGKAGVRDFITTLDVEVLNTSELPPGPYELGIRRAGGEWQAFPIRVE